MTTGYEPLLDQIGRLPLLPEGARIDFVTVDGQASLVLAGPAGIASLPVDPVTRTVDPRGLRRAVAEAFVAGAEGTGE